MGENSKIEWTTHTFNTHWGCTKVSAACKNCYADAQAHRYGFDVWGPTADRRAMSENYWKQLAKWNKAAAGKSDRPRVFCCSMADVFEGPETCQNPAAYRVVENGRERLFDEIIKCPNLDFLLLTKRPQNMIRFAPQQWTERWPDNVWAGTSAGTQDDANKFIPELAKVPAVVLFLSVEPLLESVDLNRIVVETVGPSASPLHASALQIQHGNCFYSLNRTIDWVIVGGESGHGARPMPLGWVRQLRNQCLESGVSFLFKQWGEWCPTNQLDATVPTDGRRYYSPPGDCVMLHVGKHAAGRMLDGRTWDQFPATPYAEAVR